MRLFVKLRPSGRRRRRLFSINVSNNTNNSSSSSFRPLAFDFLLLVMVFVTATIVTVHGGIDDQMKTIDGGGGDGSSSDNSGLNNHEHDESRIAHELKMFNQQHSRSRSSSRSSSNSFMYPGGGTLSSSSYSYYSPSFTPSSSPSSSFTSGNVSVYSIRNQLTRKTTNSSRRGATNHTATSSTSKRKKLTNRTVNDLHDPSLSSSRHKSSIIRLSELDRDTSGYFDNNRSEARGEWSGIDYIGYNSRGNTSSGSDLGGGDSETTRDETDGGGPPDGNSYWALVLVLFPILTIFGNSLVVMSVIREKNLKTVTNYFVVSLAIADLTVAATVMPFAVYYEVRKKWEMSKTVCDAWVATDVMASTASILNLVAIAIDRFIAVTSPIKYARHKNMNRTYITIALVWVISMAVASPIVGGLNDTDDRKLDECSFNNEKFLIFSSMASFYIPAIVMVFLYYRVFKEISARAKKSSHSKPNKQQMNRKGAKRSPPPPISQAANSLSTTTKMTLSANRQISEPPPQTPQRRKSTTPPASSEKINLISAGIFALKNKSASSAVLAQTAGSTATMLGPIAATASNMQSQSSTDLVLIEVVNNQNGLASSQATAMFAATSTDFDLIEVNETGFHSSQQQQLSNSNNSPTAAKMSITNNNCLSVSNNTSLIAKAGLTVLSADKRKNGGASIKVKKSRAQKAMNVFKSQTSTSASNKEKKVTKTLAIVLIVFLVCWTPFFTVNNIIKGLCKELKAQCAFIKDEYISFLTWLGYVNSLLNPIIYTIFNIEFRRAFEKILSDFCCRNKNQTRS